jgi:hypothetical protein
MLKVRNVFRAVVIAIALLAGATSTAVLAEPKVPSTPEEHFALAKQYKEKAEAYRKEVKEHQDMAAAYKNSTANAHEKGHGQKNPFVVRWKNTAPPSPARRRRSRRRTRKRPTTTICAARSCRASRRRPRAPARSHPRAGANSCASRTALGSPCVVRHRRILYSAADSRRGAA